MFIPFIGLVIVGFVGVVSYVRYFQHRNTDVQNLGIYLMVGAVVGLVVFGSQLSAHFTEMYRSRGGQVGGTITILALLIGAGISVVIPERYGGIRSRR
jgi:hypothetical protein